MLIQNAVVFSEKSGQETVDLRIKEGFILERGRELRALEGEELLDLEGDYLVPGFVDVHIHAFRGRDTMNGEEDVRAMAMELRKEGVAAFCPTTMSASGEDTRRALAGIRQVRTSPGKEESLVIGAHMEAPFLSVKKAGAQRKEFFRDPDLEDFLEMTNQHPEDVRLITLAPEKPGSEALVRELTGRGIVVSIGHTVATAEQVHLAGDWGANHITHTFNAQTPLNHREPGVPGAGLTDDRFYAEMICDGVHLHRDTVRLLWKAKGPERAVAITDAMEAAGLPDGSYALGGQKVLVRKGEARLEDGTLAGSVLLMREALYNMIHVFGISPRDAVRMCTETPANSVHEPLLGRLCPGAPMPATRWTRSWEYVGTVG